jgi:hypothetical protein
MTQRMPMAGASARQMALFVAVGIVIVVTLVWSVRHARSGRGRSGAAMPDFYARALKRLARRGLRPAAPETAREFSVRAGGVLPDTADTLSQLTLAYERIRFGGVRITPPEARVLVVAAGRLGRPRREPAAEGRVGGRPGGHARPPARPSAPG